MHSVVETEPFLRLIARLRLSETERERIIATLAHDPQGGDLIQGGGGLRKRRIARDGGGKSDGLRVFWFYFGESRPLFLVAVIDKHKAENITKEQLATLRQLGEMIKNED